MTERLLAFMRLLREHGLRVSVAEGLDAIHSISHVGVHDRELLRLSLRTVLVKSHQDLTTFDTLFERFFTVPRRRQRRRGQPHAHTSNDIGQKPTPQQNGTAAERKPQIPPTQSPPHSPGRESHAEKPSDMAHTATPSQELELLASLTQAWQEHLDAQSALITQAPLEPQVQARLDQPFPPDRLADMYREVERLAARLIARRALRTRRAHQGQFDIRRTVVGGLRSGREVPFTLAYRRRKISKLRLIVLCDVSGSVWQVSTFLLKLVHTLQMAFASVRSMLFVNTVVEVTDVFRRMQFPRDLELLRQHPHLSLFGMSDFGRAFYQFSQDFLGDLTRETVLLILGDARNNAFDPQAWVLDEIRQHSHRIIWLNPEPRREWNTGDSVLAAYAPFCAQVLECWTLAHLAQAAELLLQA